MIKLLIVDDDAMVRNGLIALFKKNSKIEVIGEAENGIQAIEQVKLLSPDLLLMDVKMPEMDGLAAGYIINQKFPEVKILIFSMLGDQEYVRRSIQFEASGYLLKDTSYQEIVQVIILVHSGSTYFSPGIFPYEKWNNNNGLNFPQSTNNYKEDLLELPYFLKKLTVREKQVLCLIILGYKNWQISEKLNISPHTVKNHITRIYIHLKVNDRNEATQLASFYLPLLHRELSSLGLS
jgi:DNA-binding NarL/FixJ family response regulator